MTNDDCGLFNWLLFRDKRRFLIVQLVMSSSRRTILDCSIGYCFFVTNDYFGLSIGFECFMTIEYVGLFNRCLVPTKMLLDVHCYWYFFMGIFEGFVVAIDDHRFALFGG